MTKVKNSSFSRYLQYILKKNTLRNIIMIIMGVLYLSVILPSLILPYAIGDDQDQFRHCGIDLLSVILSILCTIVPIFEFSQFNNKRNLDTVYSMPLGRDKISIAHFAGGFIQIILVYTCTFIYYFGYVILNSGCFAVGFIPLFYALSLVFGFIMYSVFTFLFTRANTTFDGVMFCLFSAAAIFLVLIAVPFLLSEFAEEIIDLYPLEYTFWGIVYFPIASFTEVFTTLIETNRYNSSHSLFQDSELTVFIIGVIGWLIIGFLSTYGYLKLNHRKPAEKTEDISASAFGYKTMIPLCSYSLMIILVQKLFLTESNIFCVIIYISMIIGYIIYRRGVKFKKSDLIMLGIGLLIVVYGFIKASSES